MEKSKSVFLANASQPLWSKDSSKFAVLMNDSLHCLISGDEIVRKKQRLCNINLTCLKNWPANSDKLSLPAIVGQKAHRKVFICLTQRQWRKCLYLKARIRIFILDQNDDETNTADNTASIRPGITLDFFWKLCARRLMAIVFSSLHCPCSRIYTNHAGFHSLLYPPHFKICEG